MKHGRLSRRGMMLLVVIGAVAIALVLTAAAFAATPTVTIVGPQYVTPSPTASPTAPALAVNDPEVHLFFQDNGWGMTDYRLSNDGGATWSTPRTWDALDPYDWWNVWTHIIDPTQGADGDHTVTVQFSNDGTGTWGATASATTLLDTQIPVVEAPQGYWNTKYPYELSSHDQVGLSGMLTLWYRVDVDPVVRIDTTEPLRNISPLLASVNLTGGTGTPHTISYLAEDYAGNYSNGFYAYDLAGVKSVKTDLGYTRYMESAYVTVDVTPPTIRARGMGSGWQEGPVNVRFTASDKDAGLCSIAYSVTTAKAKKHGRWTTGNNVVVTMGGKHKVWYKATDSAQPKGNISAPQWVMVKILK